MSYRAQLTTDLCPVCAQAHIRKGSTYCSHKCSVIAYNYRKRMSDLIKWLRGVGFKVDYCNGVQIFTMIPVFMQGAYPEPVHKFDFPEPGQAIEGLNVDDYFKALQNQLGKLVAGMLQWTFEKGWLAGEVIERIESTLKLALFDDQTSFRCPYCERVYILSKRSRPGTLPTLLACSGCREAVVERPW